MSRAFCEADGFVSYGADEADLFRRAGDYVDKILKVASRHSGRAADQDRAGFQP
jgi:ABC-type uncharacterized transport system substrate-binding protein